MNKNTFKRAMSAVAVSALALSVSSVTAFAALENKGVEYPGSADGATIKPVVTAANVTDAKPGDKVKVTFSIAGDGVNQAYASTGFHVYWDSALKLEKNEDGELITAEAGLAKLAPTVVENGNGVVIATAADSNKGKVGEFFSLEFTVPADAAPGTVYPIDICYQQDDTKGDLFTDATDTEAGKLMQAYFFTKGIYSSQNPNPDANLAGFEFADAYIKVAGETTTTTAPITTTTTAPITTTTTAPITTTTTAPITTTTTEITSTSSTTSTTTTTKATTTTTKKTTTKNTDSSKTGVTGVGAAVAGLAIAVGTAFALKKKED